MTSQNFCAHATLQVTLMVSQCVRQLIGPVIRHAVEILAEKLSKPHHCPCPPHTRLLCIRPCFLHIRFATAFSRRCFSLVLVIAKTEGVVLPPSEFSMIFGSLSSIIATQEFVVPKSIPITLLIVNPYMGVFFLSTRLFLLFFFLFFLIFRIFFLRNCH